jgi:ABC-type uncharacterized transport system substrate-binding protein
MLACLPLALRAAVAVVLSAEHDSYREALGGIQEALPGATALVLQDGKADVGGANVVIALGDAAAMADYPPSAQLVIAMVASAKVKPSRSCVRVGMLPDAFLVFSKVGDWVPSLDTLAIFSAGDNYDPYIKYLQAAAKVANIKLSIKRLDNAAGLVDALRGIAGKAQALWIPPDPLFLNPDSFKLISDFCQASKIGLIAPATSLVKVGALAGLAPSPREIGLTAGQAAAQILAGKNPGKQVEPENSEEALNLPLARTLGYKK